MDNGIRSENTRIYGKRGNRQRDDERKSREKSVEVRKEIRRRERGRSCEEMLGRIEREMEKGKDSRKLGAREKGIFER